MREFFQSSIDANDEEEIKVLNQKDNPDFQAAIIAGLASSESSG